MNPLNERQTRGYFLFLAVFSAILVFLAFLGGWVQTQLLGEAIAQREAAIASSLTEQGVPLTALATAFKNTEVTKSGLSFLTKIGHSKDTPIWLTASTDKSSAWFLTFGVCAMLLAAILLAVSFFHLSRRERLYTQAADILSKFAAGDFSVRLPRNQPGALYRMVARADQLAMALYSQNEAEHKSQEFLKQTISDISHQLKTPLSALSMYLEILQNETENPGTVRKFSEKALRSLSRIENFIQTLLKIARLDADSISFESKPCNISSLAAQATEEFRTQAASENKKLLMEGPSDAYLLCDSLWTKEALANLVKNALEHTSSGSTIRITWQNTSLTTRILVSDDGCGIPPEDIHHIFKRFYRSQTPSHSQGIGLGLPLAKAIVEGQSGILSVQSHPGEGTTFTMLFLTKP